MSLHSVTPCFASYFNFHCYFVFNSHRLGGAALTRELLGLSDGDDNGPFIVAANTKRKKDLFFSSEQHQYINYKIIANYSYNNKVNKLQ